MKNNKATETGCGSQSLKYLLSGPNTKSLLILIIEATFLLSSGYSLIQLQFSPTILPSSKELKIKQKT